MHITVIFSTYFMFSQNLHFIFLVLTMEFAHYTFHCFLLRIFVPEECECKNRNIEGQWNLA